MSKSPVNPTTENIFKASEERFKTNDLIGILQDRGVIPNVAIDDTKVRDAKQRKQLREFRNTKELLKNYRVLVYVVSHKPQSIASELDAPLADIKTIVEQCDIASSYGDTNIDNELRGAVRTTKLMDIVNKSLTAVKELPETGEMLYKLLYLTYLSEEKYSIDDIVDKLEISRPTYFRKKKEAIKMLSTFLWFAPNRELDMWIDILTLFEDEKMANY